MIFQKTATKDKNEVVNYSPMSITDRIIYSGLILFGIFTLLRYAAWWFQPSHIPGNWLDSPFHFIDLIIFSVLSFVVFFSTFLRIGAWITIWFIKRPYHIKAPTGFRVAFLTCYVPGKEPIEMLKKTLIAMKTADYQHDTWVLDEGNDQEVIDLCKELGVGHFSRKNKPQYNMDIGHFRAKTKAGNLNSWRSEFEENYDIVAQIDMDHVPHKDYLTKQVGFFTDSKVGYVIIPQIYTNTKNWVARGASEQTHFYYGPLQQGLYGAHMPFLIGTTHLYRVSAMKAFGGYAPTIAEDYLTSMHFSSNGWRGVYLPEALAEGQGPTTWSDYFNQQMRWSYGLYEILLKHTHKHFFKLKPLQQLNMFFSQLFYFSGLATFFGFILTVLYLGFGIVPSNMDVIGWVTHAIPAYLSGTLILFFLHRFYINPKKEPAIGFYGMFLAQAANIVYTIALFKIIFSRKLVYKVTAKGKVSKTASSFNTLKLHLFILILTVLAFSISFIFHNDSAIIRFWAGLNIGFISSLFLFIYWDTFLNTINSFLNHYKFLEINVSKIGILPQAPTDQEKYLYSKDGRKFYLIFSIVSFAFIQISLFGFISNNIIMWPLLGYFILTIVYFLISLLVNSFSKGFDLDAHNSLVSKWEGKIKDSVDVFLPTAGESIEVLKNTWDGVVEMIANYEGEVEIYCLDDGDREEVSRAAKEYGFHYHVRPNRGWFKKAGNLRHGFNISKNKFIVIFDADFRPRADMLSEMLPYFYSNSKIGIVQTPQYFDVDQDQNWLQRGAGAVQELFYRLCQVSRQNHDASICVGTNAIYRRDALRDTGGTALIEHSEDVHTGFNLRMYGWTIQYIPIVLAKGLCPADMKAFFKQQYRWCLGSMSLLGSEKFWSTNITFRARLSYFSGFLYYIHTAVSSFFVPVIPLALMIIFPAQINFFNYLLVLPSLIYVQIIYPLWHRATYGIESWSTRSIYGWAHFFAIVDSLSGRKMSWQPTGTSVSTDSRYVNFRILQVLFNFIPAVLWVSLAGYNIIFRQNLLHLPLLIGGVYYLLISVKVTFYHSGKLSLPASFNVLDIVAPKLGVSHAFAVFMVPFILASVLAWSGLSLLGLGREAQDSSQQRSLNRRYTTYASASASPTQNVKTSTPERPKSTYKEIAKGGDSYIKVYRRMIDDYTDDSGMELNKEALNYTENYLASTLEDKRLVVGDEVLVSSRQLTQAVLAAKTRFP